MAIELSAGLDIAHQEIPADLSAKITETLGRAAGDDDSMTPSRIEDLKPAVYVDPSKAKTITRGERDEMLSRGGLGAARSPRSIRNSRTQETDEEVELEELPAAGDEPVARPQVDEIDTDAAEADLPEIPALDPSMRIAALRQGWQNDKIDALYEFDPALALQTFANFGGQAQQAQQQVPAAPQPGTMEHLLLPENLAKFEQENGKPVTDVVRLMAAKLQRFEAIEQRLHQQEQQSLAREVDQITDAIGQNFPKVYGKDSASLTNSQVAARNKLWEHAGAIRKGMLAQTGRDIGTKAAIEQANMIFTAGQRKENAVADVRAGMKRRAGRMTTPPSHRDSRSAAVPEKSERNATIAIQDWFGERGYSV